MNDIYLKMKLILGDNQFFGINRRLKQGSQNEGNVYDEDSINSFIKQALKWNAKHD